MVRTISLGSLGSLVTPPHLSSAGCLLLSRLALLDIPVLGRSLQLIGFSSSAAVKFDYCNSNVVQN